MLRWCFALAAACLCHASPVDFDREIRPILSDRCFACHGPDEKQRMANLRLDLKAGPELIVPGDAARSKLYQRITHPKLRMPPVSAGPALTSKQTELIKRWIDEGGKWELHWAYQPPQRPGEPAVKNKGWIRNPIDSFILARLEKEGLKPSPDADKTTLLRRVTFDLTGIPPTPSEIDAYIADKSPQAYEHRVTALLNSPRYGERMAMQWMDFARYADTHGYHIDSHREQWHWRDWVIDAFNTNKPYDRFIVEQLAGDLLPNATLDQKIATGFNRNHMINFEGGAIEEEYQNEYVIDRVETTSAAFMGLTMGCARCHDHKYDPITQKDFYRFYAFFNTIPEKGLDGQKGNAAPFLQLPSREQAARLAEVERSLKSAEDAFSEIEAAKLQTEWETGHAADLRQASANGLIAHYEFDGGLTDSSGHYQRGRVLKGEPTFPAGIVDKAADFDGETHVNFGNVADFDRDRPFSIAAWVRSNGILEMPVLLKIADPASRRGFELYFDEAIPVGDLRRGARIGFRLTHQWPDNLLDIRTVDRLPSTSKDSTPRPWYHVTVNYDGSGKASGLSMLINGRRVKLDVLNDRLTGSVQNASSLEIGNKLAGRPYKGQVDDLRIYDRQLSAEEVGDLVNAQPARASLWLAPEKRSKDQAFRLRDYFLTYHAPERTRSLYAAINQLKAEQRRLDAEIPTTMVMAESEKPRDTWVLGRGDYRNHGEKVTPGVPAVLPPLPKDAPLNRLTLATWLTDPSHPLTSRVAINHFWQMYFGTGLVKTSENFGSQGDPPSNPELLDWLATEFIRTGWDVKGMQRLILTSAAYRQSSKVSRELLERDPENRLLARGPRFRLPGEMLRDNALAVSGLLNEKVGGPSVYPYQPKGLWEEIAYGDVFSAQTYSPSHGQDLYRRSMYDFWKRTSPPPSLTAFDAPDREKCSARRTITNTPLQALALLNDPTFVESARALAQRTLQEAGKDPNQRVAYAFRLATGRTPETREIATLRDLAKAELAQYRGNRGEALKLLKVGESQYDTKLDSAELAAWTTVASAILNLDETITKE